MLQVLWLPACTLQSQILGTGVGRADQGLHTQPVPSPADPVKSNHRLAHRNMKESEPDWVRASHIKQWSP